MAWFNVLNVLGLWNGGTPVPVDGANPLPVVEDAEYAPGPFGAVVTASGDTVVYTAPGGTAFRIHKTYAVPVVRGTEDAPVVTVKILNPDDSTFLVPFVWAGSQCKKLITGPAGGKIAINLDIAGRVPVSFDVEEL